MTSAGQAIRATRFRYRAVSMDGRLTKGVFLAGSIDDARSTLLSRELMPIELVAERGIRHEVRSIGPADVALVARLLADLLDSGLPLPRALATLEELAPASWRPHLTQISDEVRGGASLSDALRSTRGAVPPLMVGIVRAGEMGGGLVPALSSAAETFEASASARSNLVSALTYPAFLLVACAGSLMLLVGVVLPRFAAMLDDLNQSLPWTTAALLEASAQITEFGPRAAIAVAIGGFALWRWCATREGRAQWHRFLLRLPLVGDVRHAWASASVCATTGALLSAGVPLPAALEHAAAACGDAAIGPRALEARNDILTGVRPSVALDKRGTLTRVCIRLIRAGEESGKLATMTDRAAKLERARATRTAQRAAKLLEPALVIGFGALVAFVAASLLQAVYAVRPLP